VGFVGRFDPAAFEPRALPAMGGAMGEIPGLQVRADSGAVAWNAHHWVVCAGAPRFEDALSRQVAAERGVAAGWLQLAARFGQKLLAHVSGAYAVVLVDVRAKSVLLAVDRFAQESLCYRLEGGAVDFASRADALAGPLCPQALFGYFHDHVIVTPQTVFKGVMRLPGAGCLRITREGEHYTRHWQPTFDPQLKRLTSNAAAHFRNLLRDAVARCMAGAAGCFLSGGTDSSSIAGMMSALTGARVPTYSIGFDAKRYDELAYARVAAAHFDCAHHAHTMKADELLALLPSLAASMSQPFGNSSLAPTFLCARLAREHGTPLLLAGDGGDELFGGNARYATPWPVRWLSRVPASLLQGIAKSARGALRAKLTRVEALLRAGPVERLNRHNLLHQLGAGDVFAPGFLQQVVEEAPMDHLRAVWAEGAQAHPLEAELAYDWRITLTDNDLPKVRAACELAGVAVGFPLLDERLVDFSLHLAPALKVSGGKLRVFFKYALRDFLPKTILRKQKHGFGLPFGVWLLQHPGLNNFARDALASLTARGLLQEAFAAELMDARLPAHPGYYGEMVWLPMMLEHWLRAHAPDWRV
jgi:asparagine synthase (glutamine-hydrolysing)